jgi:hypothetical protein
MSWKALADELLTRVHYDKTDNKLAEFFIDYFEKAHKTS